MTYYKNLDGLRFIAIFFVFIEHVVPHVGQRISAGYYGVDLFFVISGFLITDILINARHTDFASAYKRFMGRRVLRIFPLYYGVLIALWILGSDAIRQNALSLFTYTFNFALVNQNLVHTPVEHFWSLCVEEQFYLFWPFVVLLLRKQLKVLLAVVFCISFFGYSQLILEYIEWLNPYNYSGLLTRMSSLGLGALISTYGNISSFSKRFFMNQWVEMLVIIIFFISLFSLYRIRFLIFGLSSVYFILKTTYFSFSLKFINHFLSNRIVVWLGTISYGLYVYHYILVYYLNRMVFNPYWATINFGDTGFLHLLKYNSWVIKFPIYAVLTVLISALSFRYFESPILRLKTKYFN